MINIYRKLVSFYNPPRFQGWGKRKQYFEGWYYKIINSNGDAKFAIIPGIAMDKKGNKHAFIQVLDGTQKTARYEKFPVESFHADSAKLGIQIANNYFSEAEINLDLSFLRGRINISGIIPWPSKILSPGIMGPYAYVPFMECYHGIVSMDHRLSGQMIYENQKILFDGGRGYIEKDWGKSFPDAYIWMQSNHFEEPGISFKSSVANIPWLKSSFVGFIAGFWWNNQLIRFTTYNRCKLVKCQLLKHAVEIHISHPKYHLEIHAERKEATDLASPILGNMNGKIAESMDAKIHIKLSGKRDGKLLFEGTGIHAGLEVAGKTKILIN